MTRAMASVLLPDDGIGNTTMVNDSFRLDELADIAYRKEIENYNMMMNIERFTLPFVCVFGLFGNTVSTIVFLQRQLRKAPCSFYLAARGISDNGFLLSLLLTWMSSTFDLRLSQVKGVCQMIVFMTYLCGCASVWLCVIITFENFLLIHSPFVARRICSEKFSIACIAVLVMVAIVIYNTSLWIINGDCSHNAAFSELTQVLVYLDTVLTLVIPTVIIFILLALIMVKVIKIVHIRRLHATLIEKLANRSRPVKNVVPMAKVTHMLLVVSLMFVVLNVPIHGMKIRLLIVRFTQGKDTTPFLLATLQTAFQLLYYFSFAANIIVYTLFGSNFRKVFLATFCFKKKARRPTVTTEAVNLVNQQRRHSITLCNGKSDVTAALLTVPIDDDRKCHSDIVKRTL